MSLPAKETLRWCIALVALFFLFYGTALRHNAIFAVLPLLCWLVRELIPCKKTRVIVPCAILLWVATLATIHYVNYNVIGAIRTYSLREIFLSDIFHLNARTNHFVLPPNTFGHDFSRLDEEIFRKAFIPEKLFLGPSIREINKQYPGTISLDLIGFIESPKSEAVLQSMLHSMPGFASEYPTHLKHQEFIRTQYPKDFPVLRKAWIDRLLQDPAAYIKFKTKSFAKYCRDNSLWFIGINPLFLLPLIFLIAISPLLTRNMPNSPSFPSVMLAWSAILYLLPMWIFRPSDEFRYLLWFFAASIIAIAHFCSQSPLFHNVTQTIHRYLEEKAYGTCEFRV